MKYSFFVYLNSFPSNLPVILPATLRPIRWPILPFFTAFTSPNIFAVPYNILLILLIDIKIPPFNWFTLNTIELLKSFIYYIRTNIRMYGVNEMSYHIMTSRKTTDLAGNKQILVECMDFSLGRIWKVTLDELEKENELPMELKEYVKENIPEILKGKWNYTGQYYK